MIEAAELEWYEKIFFFIMVIGHKYFLMLFPEFEEDNPAKIGFHYSYTVGPFSVFECAKVQLLFFPMRFKADAIEHALILLTLPIALIQLISLEIINE